MNSPSPEPHNESAPRRETREAVCPQHGPYTATRHGDERWNMWSRCDGCEAAREAEEARNEARVQAQLQAEALHKRLAESGLAPRFRKTTLQNFEAITAKQIAARTACRSFVEGLGPAVTGGLWLVGPPGVGKTHLGAAMVNHVIHERREWAAIHSGRDIVRLLRAGWGERGAGGQEQETLELLGSLQLLVIDEVGVGFGSEREMVQLFDVIDLRYRNELPTVLISNLSAAELKPVLGDAAYDRLREGAVLVPMNWASHRGTRP